MKPLADAINLVVSRADATPLQKNLVLRKLKKARRKGRLIEDPREMLDPEWRPKVAYARLLLEDYSWDDWDLRSDWAKMCWHRPDAFGIPMWKPGDDTKNLLVLGEQGLGDEIMFSQWMPDAGGFICEERLVPLMTRVLGIKCFPRHIKHELELARKLIREYGFDRYVAIADIPRITGNHRGRPYLTPDPGRVPEFERYRGRVGVSWRGRNGSYPYEEFTEPDEISLQYDQQWDEDVEQPDVDLLTDIEGITALISVLDRVKTVSTTVAHIACCLGKPVDLIVAPWDSGVSENQLNWRWGLKNRVPWYPTARVYQSLREYRAVHRRSMQKVRRDGEKGPESAVGLEKALQT